MDRCHNLYIDDGFVYLSGCNNIFGITILDVNEDPLNPKAVGAANLQYSHDVFVRDNLMFTSEIGQGQLGIYDISDKTRPELLATQQTSFSFTHNAWSSDDNKYIFTTDERANAFLDAYDISDLDQIQRVSQYHVKATQGTGVIPHNAHYHNGFLINSWYTDGIVVLDATNPESLVRVAQYDTWGGPNGGFNGCWGAYPFLPSGIVLASDISSGLFVLDVNYQRASFLKGQVLDSETNMPINGAEVFFSTSDENVSSSDPNGNFNLGLLLEGRVKAVASHPEYKTDSIVVMLEKGVVIEENILLERLNTVSVLIEVVDKETGASIEAANVLINTEENSIQGLTKSVSGGLRLDAFIGTSEIICGKLGYKTALVEFDIEESTESIRIELERGIEDDFNFIYGWGIKTTAQTGSWHRGVPLGTFFQNLKSNPDTDAPNDIGNSAFVTGPPNADVSAQDVDDGMTMLISPKFDISEIDQPIVEYSLWFFNGAGASSIPNDYMEVLLSDGIDTTVVERIVDPNSSSGRWREKSQILISDYFNDPQEIIVFVRIEDISPGHLVEGGFDDFAIVSATTTSTQDEIEDVDISIFPNAFSDFIIIKSSEKIRSLYIYDISGKRVFSETNFNNDGEINTSSISSGTYIAEIHLESGETRSYRMIKI
jgi:hypothetical protein